MQQFYRSFLLSIIFSSSVIFTNGASTGIGSRLVGGSQAGEGAFPYQVSLRTNGRHFCGGSIITVNHVVSAAHCFPTLPVDRLTVITGTNNLDVGGEAHGVSDVAIHETYIGRQDLWRYDIAILTLAAPLTITSLQSPIPISLEDPPYGSTAVVSGWGRFLPGSFLTPTKLQYLTVVTLNNTVCASDLHSSVHDVHLCAFGDYGVAVCNGDSGGPMAYNGKLVGIVSWGQSPCASGVPDAYTRVSLMIDFIERVTGLTIS